MEFKENTFIKDIDVFEKERTDILTKEFSNKDIPFKIRKINLLKNCDLEIPNTEFLLRSGMFNLQETLISRWLENGKPLVIRFASIPNQPSMPVVYVNTKNDIERAVKIAQDFVKKDETITHLIIRDYVGKDRIPERIVGRYAMLGNNSMPKDEILEFYPGAKSVEILENAEKSDIKYIRIVRESGKIANLDVPKPYDGFEEDYKLIRGLLNEQLDKMRLIKNVVAKSRERNGDDIEVCFEFYVIDDKIFFSDFD